MQFKAWVKDAVKAQSLDKACPDYSNHNNARNHRYSSMGSSMVELQPHDFDVAINILHTFNKKAKVKEYTLFKEEFIAGNASSYDTKPRAFIDDLKDAACGRSDKYTQQRIRAKVDESFPVEDLLLTEHLLGCYVFNPMKNLNYSENSLKRAQKDLEENKKNLAVVVDFLEKNKGDVIDLEELREHKAKVDPEED